MKKRIVIPVVFVGVCLAVLGCGGDQKHYTVEGTVTLDGQPLEGATVSFVDGGTVATGITTASGKFKLITNGGEGPPAGTYKVGVAKHEASKAQEISQANQNDPTKAYLETMKAGGGKPGGTGKIELPKAKSEIPERYSKVGALPDVVVPTSGPVAIELKSK